MINHLTILGLVVALVATNLLGIHTSAIIFAIAAVAVVLTALQWVFTGRPPTRNTIIGLALLFIGPTLLQILLQMGVVKIQTWPSSQALLLLLIIGVAVFWLGRKWRG